MKAAFRLCRKYGVIIVMLIISCYFLFLLEDLKHEQRQRRQLKQCPILKGLETTFTNDLNCNCARAEKAFPFPRNWSSCDYYSSARGKYQKVVAYSFYGNTSSKYFQGVEQSVLAAAQFYPDWVMRLYHNINTSDPKQNSDLCNLWCKYYHLDLCDVKILPFPLCNKSEVFGMLWRFFPLGDPLVERFIVRDIDSPIIVREVEAVEDWIRRNKTFHIMRDHPYHNVYILGGMWGASNRDRETMEKLRGQFISNGLDWVHGKDQELLLKIVWPYANNDCIAHDSYKCNTFPNTVPFPTKRENFTYVGCLYEWRNQKHPLKDPCPKECRPPQHPDWDYC